MEKKLPAAGQQPVKAVVFAAEMKTRDIMRDRLGGNLQGDLQKHDKGDGELDQAVFAFGTAELRTDDELKKPMNHQRQKIDRGKNEASAPDILHAPSITR